MAGFVGTLLAIIGALIALVNVNEYRISAVFVLGAVIVFAGIMLRIEQAVRDRGRSG